jgi:general secretion pathway protein L
MGHRVIGVDIGTKKVRVVVINVRLRKTEVTALYECDRESLADARNAIDRALGEPPTVGDMVSITYPATTTFIKKWSFPFKDTKRIQAALPFQFVGVVPLQPAEIHCAFERSSGGAGGSTVVAVAVQKNDFGAFLAEMSEAGIEPSHVGVDALTLSALLPLIEARPVMLAFVSGERADFVVASEEGVELARSTVVTDEAVKDGEVSEAFLREALFTISSASASGWNIEKIYVAGENSEAVAKSLGEATGTDAVVLDLSSLPVAGLQDNPNAKPEFAKALSLALASASGGGLGSINLLCGEFQKEGKQSIVREHGRFFAVVAVLFALLATLRIVSGFVGVSAERAGVAEQAKALSKSLLGEEIADASALVKRMKGVIEEDYNVFPTWTAYTLLQRLFMTMGSMKKSDGESDEGKGEPMEVESIRIDGKTMTLRGEAESIEILDAFIGKLKDDPCFHNVTTESTERIQFQRHQGWQRFSLKADLDCSGSAPSKPQTKTANGG